MPELPEVETTRRGLAPLVTGRRVQEVVVRNRHLRQPVPRDLPRIMAGATIHGLGRRAKYLLFDCGAGTLILHLGMSGRLWVVGDGEPPTAHDHFDLKLEDGTVVRLRDPRRFGLVLWQRGDPLAHRLLKDIGPEPFSDEFDGACPAPGHAQPQRRDQAGPHGQPRRRGRRQHLRQRSAVSRGHPSPHAREPGEPRALRDARRQRSAKR